MMDFIKRNWIGVLGLLVGFLGIFLSYYFYTLSQQDREPYFIEESNFPIFFSQKELISQGFVLVRKSDGREITKRVYVNEIAIWNKGKLSIKRDNILKSITLAYPEDVEVIDAFISSVTRPDIVNVDIPSLQHLNIISLGFDILEESDGFKVQVTYLSDSKSTPDVAGTIEGVNGFGDSRTLTKSNILFGVAKLAAYILGTISILFIYFGLERGVGILRERYLTGRFEKISKALVRVIRTLFSIFWIVLLCIIAIEKVKDFAEQEGKAAVPVMKSNLNKPIQPTAEASAD